MTQCNFCFNAYVYAELSKPEEDYFDEGLDDTNDGGSSTIGISDEDFRLFINSGMGEAINIEVCQWGINKRWNTIAKYYPKYCPECGRKLSEYEIAERGTSFNKTYEM